jgi:amino acid adenylation domain-containing protein
LAFLLHHLLTDSAARWPEKQAVRERGEELTYGQLDRLTNQLARTLWSAGVRRGDRVGIYVHKSLASIVSIFGILKAGGVYVPLDPSAPPSRLAYITRNCDVRVLLTASDKTGALAALYEAGTPLTSIVLTDDEAAPAPLPQAQRLITWDEVRGEDKRPLPPGGTIETDLAYILYTSGSTGHPKGVMIAHRTIFAFINWCDETFQIKPDDRVTSHAPLHFDLSTFDIYVTIMAGATVVLVPEKLSIFPVQFVQLLQEERITVTYLVPSILSMIVNYGQLHSHDLSALRLVLFAGEVFPVKYLRQLVAAIPQADYYNLYGPTETNVCTYYKVQPRDLAPERAQAVPIGVACANTEVFAVDDQGELVSHPGREGELWVRGSCVAQGYWADPEKTARNFVRNLYQPHFDEVAYRTGDIVVLDEDGLNWRYVGRRDHMIKSRGYRIELGEIEATLYTHAGVKEAAVVAIPDELIGNRLKAFIVPIEDEGLSVKELRAHCSTHLPGYMVPESIEFRPELPKTSSGKVNRPLLAGSPEK